MTRLAKLNGTWYAIDFGQKTYWSVTSQTQLQFLSGVARIPALPDGDTSILNGFRRIT